MNLRQLRYFVGVVDAGNMTRAADHLHVAQTALGMQIKQIEDDLGVALLLRHSRGVEPTKAGKLLYDRAVEILKRVDETRKEVIAAEGDPVEVIRLGITPALMAAVGPDIALAGRDQISHVFLSMVEAMSHVLTDMLERGEVDVILGYDIPDQPQFLRTALMEDDLFFVSRPQGRGKRTIAMVDVVREELAMPEAGDTVRNAALRAAKELGHELNVAYEVRSISAMKSLVLRGVAYSILPLFAVADEINAGLLEAKQITSPPVRRTLYLAYSAQRATFRYTESLAATIRHSLDSMIKRLGPHASKSWVRVI